MNINKKLWLQLKICRKYSDVNPLVSPQGERSSCTAAGEPPGEAKGMQVSRSVVVTGQGRKHSPGPLQ